MEILIISNNFRSTEWIHQSNAGKALVKSPGTWWVHCTCWPRPSRLSLYELKLQLLLLLSSRGVGGRPFKSVHIHHRPAYSLPVLPVYLRSDLNSLPWLQGPAGCGSWSDLQTTPTSFFLPWLSCSWDKNQVPSCLRAFALTVPISLGNSQGCPSERPSPTIWWKHHPRDWDSLVYNSLLVFLRDLLV